MVIHDALNNLHNDLFGVLLSEGGLDAGTQC